MRRQLKALQKVAFNVQDEDEEEEGGEDGVEDPERTTGSSGQLEILLSTR